jgi:hypothetical protein
MPQRHTTERDTGDVNNDGTKMGPEGGRLIRADPQS